MQNRNVKYNKSTEKSILDNPLNVLGIVVLSVSLILTFAELLSYKSVPKESTVLTKTKEDSTKNNKATENTEATNTAKEIKKRIAAAKDTTELNKILDEVKSESAALEKITNQAELKSLEQSISIRKIKLQKSKEEPLPVIEEPIASIPGDYQQMLRSAAFDLSAATRFKDQYKGYDRNLINSLEYYKKVAEHKADYNNIISELRKLGDNSYYEKAEKLMRKKFKNKSIDDFEAEDQYLFDSKPSWITAAQEAEMRRWGDEIDEELERIDSDY